MTSRTFACLRVTSVLLLAGAPARAQSGASSSAPAGFRGEFLRQLADVEKKVTSLAQAMPQEKYSWRPGEGVRSVSEVFVHIAGANYLFPSFIGVKPPAGVSRDMEKTVTEKAKVAEILSQSFQHARQAVQDVSDADLDKPIKLFGRSATTRELFFIMANHMHEHLGQSIAYARVNGVVPPWSAKEQ